MSLRFLTPAGAGARPARSPLADAAAAAGAVTELRAGWELAVSFGDPAAEAGACAESVAFADLSHLTKLELQGPPTAIDAAVHGEAAGGDAASGPGLGLARREDGIWRCPLTPVAALVLADPADAGGAWSELEPAGVRALDLSSALGAIAIAGPAARELLARFCALDTRDSVLPPHGFRPVSVARTPGYILRETPERFLMLFGAAYGSYVWEVVAHTAARLGGRPVGVDALPALEPAVSGGGAVARA